MATAKMEESAANMTTAEPTGEPTYQLHPETIAYLHFAIIEKIFKIIIGGVLNMWLLGSILTSLQMRSKFRNQLICALTVFNLIELLILDPLGINLYSSALDYKSRSCQLRNMTSIMHIFQLTISNVFLLPFTISYLLQVLQYKIETRLKPVYATVGKIAIHVFPYVVFTIAMVIVVETYDHDGCIRLIVKYEERIKLGIAFLITPLVMSFAITCTAFVLHRRSHTATTGVGSYKVDNVLAYAFALAICIVCDLPGLAKALGNYSRSTFCEAYWDLLTSEIRAVVMVFPWLFLYDVRERIKIWRPWKKTPTPPGIDLTMEYHNSNNEA